MEEPLNLETQVVLWTFQIHKYIFKWIVKWFYIYFIYYDQD